MSTVTETVRSQIVTPKSPKKRKADSHASTKSTKKRKQANSELDTTSISQSTTTTEDSKKQRSDRKRKGSGKSKEKKLEDVQDSEVETQVVQVTPTLNGHDEDIELIDAPSEEQMAAQNNTDTALSNHVSIEDDIAPEFEGEVDETMLHSQDSTSFYSKRLSLYVSIPSISLASSTSSILSLHLTPLLLTYFPPAEGIVLSFSDAVLSAKPDTSGVNLPLRPPTKSDSSTQSDRDILARCADGFGVSWVWLTANFLVFKPQPGDTLKGWINVQSEGFVGLVSYNYFQTAVGKSRIPKAWRWDGISQDQARKKRMPKKGKLRDDDGNNVGSETVSSSQANGVSDEAAADEGINSFFDADGKKISEAQIFKVVDIEMVPSHERDRFTLQIDGSLLPPEEEQAVMDEERKVFESQKRITTRARTPGLEDDSVPLMSGGIALNQEAITI